MKVRHLNLGDVVWCKTGADEMHIESTENPRDATCSDCLRNAAEYGAAAAMRCAAVEAGVTHDPELQRERDEAIRRVDAINNALERQFCFFCTGCLKLFEVSRRALNINATSWCSSCAPHRNERAL